MDGMLERIKNIMSQRGLSAYKVTQILGISNSAFTDWSKGKARPNVETLAKLSNLFNVSLDYLVFGEERYAAAEQEPSQDGEIQQSMVFTNSADVELISKYHRLPTEYQGKVDAFIEGMLAVLDTLEGKSAKLSG